jgi:uncharacterized protein YeaO (DUF488 family)
MNIKTKRVYAPPAPEDGRRVLVDRLWPRGLTKEKAHVDIWLKEIAPSSELRKWFAHDPAKWKDFRHRYTAELKKKQDLIKLILQENGADAVTLLYAARDVEHNEAVVLKHFLDKKS